MAYSALTFTASEVPTLTKWNQLWANDASFNDGTGIGNGAIITRHLGASGVLQIPQANLAGLTWTTWTPTFTNFTLGNGTVVARYVQIGKTTHFSISILLGSTSSILGSVSISLPFNVQANYSLGATKEGAVIGNVMYLDTGNQIFYGVFQVRSNDYTKADPMAMVASGTYVSFANWQGTIPIALGSGDVVYITGTYEAA